MIVSCFSDKISLVFCYYINNIYILQKELATSNHIVVCKFFLVIVCLLLLTL